MRRLTRRAGVELPSLSFTARDNLKMAKCKIKKIATIVEVCFVEGGHGYDS
jgi:hypothetical protein